jgi:hypothetical protein
MSLPSEEQVKALSLAVGGIEMVVQKDKVPGPLRDLGNIANQELFKYWLTCPGALQKFASSVLNRQTDLRATTAVLPEGTRDACWKLIELLECARDG